MMLAVRTNVSRWASPYCLALDSYLEARGVHLIDLPWDSFELLRHDQNHFTARGFDAFRSALATALSVHGVQGDLFVLSDSTVDHLNRGRDERPADVKLQLSMRAHQIHATVSSQCGSGYCALRDQDADFGSLARAELERPGTRARDAHWLIIGGWNDEWNGYGIARAQQAAGRLIQMRNA